MVSDASSSKRLKLDDTITQPDDTIAQPEENPMVESTNPERSGRMRKVAQKRTTSNVSINDLCANCLLEVLDHLSIADLCNVAKVNQSMKEAATLSFRLKCSNGFQIPYNYGVPDMVLLNNVLYNFGRLITSITISAGARHE